MKKFGCGKILMLVSILLLSFGLPIPVHAQSLVYGDTVPAGTVVDQNVMLVGQNVTVAGTVNGDVFVLGNQVTINGTINGSLILMGQNAVIGGSISGGVYAVVLTLEINAPASLGRDLYLLTVSVESAANSAIQRDLFAITLDAGLNGRVGRNLHTSIGPLQLYNSLMRLLGFEELTIKLHFEIPPSSFQPGLASSAGNAGLTKIDFRPAHLRAAPKAIFQAQPFDWSAWGINLARDWIVLTVLGLLAYWLAGGILEKAGAALQARPGRTTLLGLLVFVISLNLFALALLLVALFFVLGLAMNSVGLWQLSIALWIVVYSILAFLLTVLWFFIAYGTKLIVIYMVFTWLFNRIHSSDAMKMLAMLIGALIYSLLRSVPYIGWIVDVLVTAGGMGSAWLAYRLARELNRQKPAETVVAIPGVGKRGAKQPV